MPTFTPSTFRGLLICDDRVEGESVSASSEASPEVDTPVPATGYKTDLVASGDSDGTERTVTIFQAGTLYPGRGARWTWGDASGNRGWWPYWQLTGLEEVFDGSSLYARSSGAKIAGAVSVREGRMCLVWLGASGVKAAYQTLVPSTSVGMPIYTRVTVDASATDAYAIVEVEGDFYLFLKKTQLCIYRSTDGGATWVQTVNQAQGFTEPTGFQHMSVAYHQGYFTMMVSIYTGGVFSSAHYVSADLGASWTAVSDSGAYKGASLVTCQDGTVMLFFTQSSSNAVMTLRKGAPYEAFSNDPNYNAGLGLKIEDSATSPWESDTASVQMRACLGEDGTIYLLGRIADGANEGYRVRVVRIRQGYAVAGDRIDSYPYNTSLIADAVDYGVGAASGLDLWALFFWQGSLCAAATYSTDKGPFLVRWGGWGSIAFRSQGFGQAPTSIWGKAFLYMGNSPATHGWTATGAGTGSAAQYGWNIVTVANTLYYSRSTAIAAASSAAFPFVWARVYVTAGGSSSADGVAIRLIADRGTTKYDVSLRLTTTAAYLIDNNAVTTLDSVTGLSVGVRDWLIAIKGDVVSVRYKDPSSTLWLELGGDTMTGAASSTVNTVRFGNLAAGSATSKWYFVGTAIDDNYGAAIPTGSETNPAWGLELSAAPQYMEGGTYVSAMGGPAQLSENWTLPAKYRYGIEYALPASPGLTARSWRSTVVTESTVTLDLGEQSSLLSTAVGVVLVGARFTSCVLEASTNGAAWTNLGSIDCGYGLSSVGFTRTGNIISRNSGTGTLHAAADELAGGWFWDGTTMTEIEGNAAGTWASGSPLQIRLTSGSGVAASGTGTVIWPQIAAVVYGITTAYRYWRIRIPNASGASYYELKKLLIGGFLPFGYDYGWGRSIGTELIQDIQEFRNGSRLARQRAQRRVVETAWPQGIPAGGTGSVIGLSPDPTWLRANSQNILGRKDPAFLEGALRRAKGSQRLCCYLPAVESAPSSGIAILAGREQLMVCRIEGGGERSSVAGSEQAGEVTAIAALRLVEAV